MPRKQKSWKEPIVWIDENLLSRQKEVEVFSDEQFGTTAFPKKREGRYWIVEDFLEKRLREIRTRRKKENLMLLDEGLVYLMMSHFDMAKKKPEKDENDYQIIKNGNRAFRLKSVGCRVYLTKEEIGEIAQVSVDKVEEHIKIMREEELIVNWGRGWNEFDACLAWCGEQMLRTAYTYSQQCRQPMTIIVGDMVLRWGIDSNEAENE